jgi:hypothetical protein
MTRSAVQVCTVFSLSKCQKRGKERDILTFSRENSIKLAISAKLDVLGY